MLGAGEPGIGSFRGQSGQASMAGTTPRSISMACKLIFWYLLTLQKSVMQTVRSAKAPNRMTRAK